MSMKRCDNGHFYDSAKHASCPWCGVAAAEAESAKTRPLKESSEPRRDAEATVAVHRQASGVSPVVGWLVCIEGADRGRDYRLHGEKNFVGRAPAMDVCIAGDEAISREKHAAVSFEPKKRMFWLLPGESSGLVYLNEEVVNTPTQIKSRDVIEIGRTKLVFFPFCDEQFNWDS
jgi:hypothetical protein